LPWTSQKQKSQAPRQARFACEHVAHQAAALCSLFAFVATGGSDIAAMFAARPPAAGKRVLPMRGTSAQKLAHLRTGQGRRSIERVWPVAA